MPFSISFYFLNINYSCGERIMSFFTQITALFKFWQFSRNTGLSDDDDISFVEGHNENNENQDVTPAQSGKQEHGSDTKSQLIETQKEEKVIDTPNEFPKSKEKQASDDKSKPSNVLALYNYDTNTVLNQLGSQCCDTIIYSHKIAKAMCCYMSLAYETDAFMREYLQKYNGNVLLHHQTASILSFPLHKLMLVTFSGTKVESLKDWWVNITGTFSKEWNNIKPSVVESLVKECKTDYNIVFCGHSKGGIEAILAFTELQNHKDIIAAGLNNRFNSCYVAGIPDYFVLWDNPTPGIFNIKDARDPVSNILGSKMANWEIRIGEKGNYSINYHRIVSYFEHL